MSNFPLIWMADVLRDAGCTVIEEPEWKTRGRPRPLYEDAVMLHHDASPEGETSNGVDVIRDGRPGLQGPLGNLWLAFDGTWHCVAAGSANHGGEGGPWGVVPHDGANTHCIGIETDHTTNEQWSLDQRSEGLLGVWALTQHMGITTPDRIGRAVLSHQEYAPDRKVDPHPLDMNVARANLAAFDPHRYEETFMDQFRKKNTVAQVIDADGRWHTIRLSKSDDPTGVYGVASGPFHWLLDVAITTDEMPAGEVLLMRAVSTEGDAENVTSGSPIGAGTAAARAAQHFTYSGQGWTDEGQWLRVQVQTTHEVSLTLVETATTTW